MVKPEILYWAAGLILIAVVGYFVLSKQMSVGPAPAASCNKCPKMAAQAAQAGSMKTNVEPWQ